MARTRSRCEPALRKAVSDGGTVTRDDFSITGPHTLTAATLERQGSDKQVPVVVDLADAIKKIPVDR
jgi:hypothetical protein